MRRFVREALLLTLAATVSWWLFMVAPAYDLVVEAPLLAAPVLAVSPRIEEPSSMTPEPELPAQTEEAPSSTEPPVEEVSSPEPPEEGPVPDEEPTLEEPAAPGEAEVPAPVEGVDAEETRDEEGLAPDEPESPAATAAAQDLMNDSELLQVARQELEDGHAKGFATVLLAAPEDQLAIASFFSEELVLVPRKALDPDQRDPLYYRLVLEQEPRVEAVHDRPPLENYRQYRDLFDYEYARLPEPLRSLRRTVPVRTEIYLFAALIPVPEWAVIVGRRREALRHSGRDASEVRRFVLRYLRHADGSMDTRVEAIEFKDGKSFRPEVSR